MPPADLVPAGVIQPDLAEEVLEHDEAMVAEGAGTDIMDHASLPSWYRYPPSSENPLSGLLGGSDVLFVVDMSRGVMNTPLDYCAPAGASAAAIKAAGDDPRLQSFLLPKRFDLVKWCIVDTLTRQALPFGKRFSVACPPLMKPTPLRLATADSIAALAKMLDGLDPNLPFFNPYCEDVKVRTMYIYVLYMYIKNHPRLLGPLLLSVGPFCLPCLPVSTTVCLSRLTLLLNKHPYLLL
jgi:hypothetical protein